MGAYRDKKTAIGIAAIVLALVFMISWIKVSSNSDLIYPFFSDDGSNVELNNEDITHLNDCEMALKTLTVTGDDTYIVYNTELAYCRSIRINLAKALNTRAGIQLFYATVDHGFSEESSARADLERGNLSVDVPLNVEEPTSIRIDFELPVGTDISLQSVDIDTVKVGFTDILFSKAMMKYALFYFILGACAYAIVLIAIMIATRKRLICSKPARELMCSIALMTIVFIILYGNFIFGDMTYVYDGVGSDTINQYWPRIQFNISKIREGINSGYFLQKGFGEYVYNISSSFCNPFDWVFFFSSDPIALIISLYLKNIWVVCFGWGYFRKKFKKSGTIIACTMLWTICGWFLLWGQHYDFATSFAFFTSVLFFLESIIEKKKYSIFMPIILGLFTAHSYYFTYMAGIFSVLYLMIVAISKKIDWKSTLFMVIRLASYEAIGILLFAGQIYVSVSAFLNSARTGTLQFNIVDALKPIGFEYFVTILGRFLSSDTWGGGMNYTGLMNYYEMAISYASILTITALAYYLLRKGKTKTILVTFSVCVLLMLPITHLMLMLVYPGFRWTFLLAIVVTLLIGYFLENLYYDLVSGNSASTKTMLIVANAIFIVVLSIVVDGANCYHLTISNNRIVLVLIFWLILNIGFICISSKKLFSPIKYWGFILVFILAEQCVANYNVINNRGEISRQALDSTWTTDGTEDALNVIRGQDTGVYRISRTYRSRFYDDAYVQGFNGLESYISVHNKYLIELMDTWGLPLPILNSPNYVSVPANERYANELLGTKYLLASEGEAVGDGYKSIIPDFAPIIYRDENSLPFGYLYDKVLNKDVLSQLSSTSQKTAAMMIGFYYDGDEKLDDYDSIDQVSSVTPSQIEEGREQLKGTKITNISVDGKCYSANIENQFGKKAMLCIPLIYEENWDAFIDGEQTNCYNINGGLVGIEVPDGSHFVELRYNTEYYDIANLVSLVSGILFVLYLAGLGLKKYLIQHRHLR